MSLKPIVERKAEEVPAVAPVSEEKKEVSASDPTIKAPVADVQEAETIKLSPADIPMYSSEDNHFFPYFPRAVDLPPGVPFRPLSCGRILELPGHTPGGSGILFDDGKSKFLLSGDTVFNCSIGRTDLPGGNYGTLISSIRTQILTLPEDLEIFPGHGSSTTVGNERVNNPFLSMR